MKKISYVIIFIIFIGVIIGISQGNNSNTQNASINIDINNTSYNSITISNNNFTNTETSENIIHLEDYPSFIEECFEKISPKYSIFTDAYSISINDNSSISIYFYSDKYYKLSTYSNNITEFSKELLEEISKKQYEKKLFQPENVLLQIKYCGYGKDLNSKQIESYTHPLAILNIETNDLKNNTDFFNFVSNNIEIYDYWF